MAGIPIDEAELIAIFLESFLYGIFFTLFWITLWILLKRQGARSSRSLIAVLFLMLVLSTSHIFIDWIRIIEAFIFHADPARGGPTGYYGQISHPLYIAKNVIYTLMAVTGDTVMAWRCYVVYRRNILIVIFPAVLIIGTVVSAAFIISQVSRAPAGATIFVTAAPWLTTLFVLGLCTNAYSTCSIVYRIWRSMHSLGPHHKGSNNGLMPVIMALVESGGLHASAWLALLVTYLAGSNGQYAALDTITPLVGIVYSLIIIQIDAYASGSWRSVQRPAYTSPGGYPMHPVDITVTTHKAMHIDQAHSPTSSSMIDTSKVGKHSHDAEEEPA